MVTPVQPKKFHTNFKAQQNQRFTMDKSVNVFGEPLGLCGTDPITGFFRDGVSVSIDRWQFLDY